MSKIDRPLDTILAMKRLYVINGHPPTIDDLVLDLGVSIRTLWRSISILLKEGKIKKIKNGMYYPIGQDNENHVNYVNIYKSYTRLKRRKDSYFNLNAQSDENVIKRAIITIGEMVKRGIDFNDINLYIIENELNGK